MRLFRLLLAALFVVLAFSWGEAHAQSTDGIVILRWTAPGDDSLTGTAAHYDLRYSLFPISEANFALCSGPPNIPTPAAPGTEQQITIYGLFPGMRYYFALKTADERYNWSGISNVIAFTEGTTGVSDQPLNVLSFSAPSPNPARTQTSFAFVVPERSMIEAEVFDVQGRMVKRLARGEHPAGSGSLSWDLRDWSGVTVSAGIYLVRARLGDVSFTRRVVVTR